MVVDGTLPITLVRMTWCLWVSFINHVDSTSLFNLDPINEQDSAGCRNLIAGWTGTRPPNDRSRGLLLQEVKSWVGLL